MKRIIASLVTLGFLSAGVSAADELDLDQAMASKNNRGGVELKYSREQLITKWAARIQALLDDGKLPLIDVQTSIKMEQVNAHIPDDLDAFDEYAIALTMADGYQRPKDGTAGYRWSNYIIQLVNDYPDYFVPTANGGTNKNWLRQKSGRPEHYIDQMEREIRSGKYFSMGEVDFRHYMSNSQCRKNKIYRDSDIPLNGKSGHRLFKLAEDNNVILVIHLEPEDHALDALEEMLKAYPKAKIIAAHFTQLRKPEVQRRFTAEYVHHLLSSYPNLHYDLSIGQPNRKYRCSGPNNDEVIIGDTAIWDGEAGDQRDTIRTDYKSLLSDYSDRFVFATDYGSGRRPLPDHLARKAKNFHQIIRDLPEDAKHNIAYRNAWRLLTGKHWGSGP